MEPYEFLIKTIREAGILLLEKRDAGFETLAKDGDVRNIVTSVDLEVNEFIINNIKLRFPEHGIYSEESATNITSAEFLWTIDPIDGTANFSRGIPHFAICIGLLRSGNPIIGAVYNPVTEELFSFKKGEGAFLNGKRIAVSLIVELKKAHVFFHAGRRAEDREWGGKSYSALLGHAKKTQNFGGSALDTCFVAAGKIEANIYGTLSSLDIAAAIGILKEAGGIITNEKGEEISSSKEPRKVFMTNNREILRQLLKIL